DLLLVLVPLEEREVDDPAQFETVAVDEVQLLAGARARRAGEVHELLRVAGDEKGGVAIGKAQLPAQRLGALLADVLGNRSGAFELVAFLTPEDVAEARLAFALRPGIHAVAEGAAAAGLGGNGPDLGFRIVGQDVGENLEAG